MPHQRSLVAGLAVLVSCTVQAFVQDDAVALLQRTSQSSPADALAPPPSPPLPAAEAPAATAAAPPPAAAAPPPAAAVPPPAAAAPATAAPSLAAEDKPPPPAGPPPLANATHAADPGAKAKAAKAEAASAAPPRAGKAPQAQKKKHRLQNVVPEPPEEKFQPGESVKMKVEMGQLAGTLVPAVVKQIRGNGKYRVRVLSTPVSRDIYNVPGRSLVKVEENKFPEAVKLFRESSQVAMKAVEQLEKEANIRLRNDGLKNKINGTALAKWVGGQRIIAEKEVEREARALGCPNGYTLFTGNGRGIDRLGSSSLLADTAELCGDECAKQMGCNAFQWSPNRKNCILDKAPTPANKKNSRDQLYCGRGSVAAKQ